MSDQSRTAILCPPCEIIQHDSCWRLDGDETAGGPCGCWCHDSRAQDVAGGDSGGHKGRYVDSGLGFGEVWECDDDCPHPEHMAARCEFSAMGMRCVLPEHGDKGHCPSICEGGPCGLCSARYDGRSKP